MLVDMKYDGNMSRRSRTSNHVDIMWKSENPEVTTVKFSRVLLQFFKMTLFGFGLQDYSIGGERRG